MGTRNRLAQADPKAVHFRPLINAVLAARGAGRCRLSSHGRTRPQLNTPDWLWKRWVSNYGEATARAIARPISQFRRSM